MNKRKKKAIKINFTNAYGFALACYDLFGGPSEKTDSSINGENTTIKLYILFVYYIKITLLLH